MLVHFPNDHDDWNSTDQGQCRKLKSEARARVEPSLSDMEHRHPNPIVHFSELKLKVQPIYLAETAASGQS